MCKEKQKSGENTKTDKWPTTHSVFLFIAIIFTLTMAFLISWPIINDAHPVHEVSIQIQIPQDSLAIEQVLKDNDSRMRVLVDELNNQSEEISKKYELLVKSQETESDFFRLLSCLVAFVVALLGFLGYKTIKDIEDKAKSLAETTAKEYTKNNLEQEVEKQLKGLISKSEVANILRAQMLKDFKENYFTPFDNRIKALESKSDSAEEEREIEVVEQEDVFAYDVPEIEKLNKTEGGEGNE